MKIICINKFDYNPETKSIEFVGCEYYGNKRDFKSGLSYLRTIYPEDCLSVTLIDTDSGKKTTWKALHHETYHLDELEYCPSLL